MTHVSTIGTNILVGGGHNNNLKEPPQLPKSISYDGKKDWKSFITKFNTFAREQRWNTRERKNNLCWCLDDKAGEFYARLVERDPDLDYFDILDRLERRFDLKELPETAQVYFQYASQHPKESLVDWADRVVSLAMKAYPDLTDNQIYRQAILRVCQGCSDRGAGHYAINMRPATMEDTVDKIRWFQHTDKVMNERPRHEVRSVVYPDTEDREPDDLEEYDQYTVARTFRAKPNDKPKQVQFGALSDDPKPKGNTVQRIEKLETRIEDLDSKLDKIMDRLDTMSVSMAQQMSMSPVRGTTKVRCYGCGKEGHYKSSCPDLPPKVSEIYPYGDLNNDGSDC